MKAIAATGSPIAPSSISLRQVCRPPPRKVSGALPTRRPFSRASARVAAPSARRVASGFSV